MKKLAALFFSIVFCFANAFATRPNNYKLLIAPGTLTANSIAIVWDKQYNNNVGATYQVFLNNKVYTTTEKTNAIITDLIPNTNYTVGVVLSGFTGMDFYKISFKTSAKSKIFNILDYGAKDDTTFKNTTAIQKAINACTPGGTVYIPKGVFISGALFLKSNITLYIEKDGVLKGSSELKDYLPMIKNRFEGWEMKTYASLINAGTLNRDGSYSVKNIHITGQGTIAGGGRKLGADMIADKGLRCRGRLICLMNCQNVDISNLTVTDPPSWTVHFIYSNNITCHDLNIITYNIANGDGIDPDSSTDTYIFNCTFDNGDDCIAIKSGKNPEGYYVGKPTKNVRITNCNFKRGHGISIGSEISGGISDILVQDCKAGALLNGMQIKGTKERGGYVKNITVTDCELMQVTIFSQLNYNNDGEAAPQPPTFENFTFTNIDLSNAPLKKPTININGFKDAAHKLKNVNFTNISLPDNAKVIINDAQKVNFTNVKTKSGAKPEYTVENGESIVY